MRFEHFQYLLHKVFASGELTDGSPPARFEHIDPDRLPPLVLAYIGDAVFNLYIRTRMLKYEQDQVRVLHTYGASMVSAARQAAALHQLEDTLSPEEAELVRRGRNAKSSVPRSASVAEYRYSTGFEALLGYLFLSDRVERAMEIAEQSFAAISREMAKPERKGSEQK